jgi:hypothetical protein
MTAVNQDDDDDDTAEPVESAEGGADITIYIDRNAFRVPLQAVTGRALRETATPAISDDYELYHVLPGSEDLLVRDEEVVELEHGIQFFSAPRMILAGRSVAHTRVSFA